MGTPTGWSAAAFRAYVDYIITYTPPDLPAQACLLCEQSFSHEALALQVLAATPAPTLVLVEPSLVYHFNFSQVGAPATGVPLQPAMAPTPHSLTPARAPAAGPLAGPSAPDAIPGHPVIVLHDYVGGQRGPPPAPPLAAGPAIRSDPGPATAPAAMQPWAPTPAPRAEAPTLAPWGAPRCAGGLAALARLVCGARADSAGGSRPGASGTACLSAGAAAAAADAAAGRCSMLMPGAGGLLR